ncbi:WD domain G-beta repeat family protein [Cryptosporidium meleagridis]|uniref:WD domain G-beta repeat family protein n=1 Tax=Cryptosporidium meleagridis TaxID=93969 RepID=A0A2P4Z5Z2_9CRYT|nr:WD domain G-beta repeat family protein [Cryptosporidium meleagridis]
MEEKVITSRCLNIHFQRDYEYIHDIACDENGEYIYVICTNLLKIYKYERNDDLNLLTIIKSQHENAITKCIICPIISEKYSLFATISDDNTIGIWLLNKNYGDILKLSIENTSSSQLLLNNNDNNNQVNNIDNIDNNINKLGGICNMTARLRDSRNTIINSSFILNYENNNELTINTSTISISLIVFSKDGHFRIYSCQDSPLFHNWSIIKQFTCHKSINNYQMTSFSFINNLTIIENDIYNVNLIAIGSNNGMISIFANLNSIMDDQYSNNHNHNHDDDHHHHHHQINNNDNIDKKSNELFSTWDCLYDTKDINTRSNNKNEDDVLTGLLRNYVLDVKWCPNYSRNYEILATSHDSFIYFSNSNNNNHNNHQQNGNYDNNNSDSIQNSIDNNNNNNNNTNNNNKNEQDDINQVFKDINGIPWIGIWRWDLYEKNRGKLILIYSIINQTNYPTNCISWDIKGTEFIACTEYNITRFIQSNNINTIDEMDDDLDDIISIDSLIFHGTKLKEQKDKYIINDFPLFVKFIRPI